MRVEIDCDEWYPVYEMSVDDDGNVELTEAEVSWVKGVFAEFQKVQTFLIEKGRAR